MKLAEWQYEQYGSMVKYSKDMLIYKIYGITWTSDRSSQYQCSRLARGWLEVDARAPVANCSSSINIAFLVISQPFMDRFQ